MKRLAALLLMITLLAAGASSAPKKKQCAAFDPALPLLGTQFHALPEGDGKELAEGSCLPCHSADILVQSGYTDVSNMQGGFGGAKDPSGRVVAPGWLQFNFPVEK